MPKQFIGLLILLLIIIDPSLVISQLHPKRICNGGQIYNAKFLSNENQTTKVYQVRGKINKRECEVIWVHNLALTYMSFRGNEFDGYNIPFVGQCTKHISAIIINGHKHKIENRFDIFFRQRLKLETGYNRINVNIELENGELIKDNYIEITIVDNGTTYNLNINER